jgi:hypothetical protein
MVMLKEHEARLAEAWTREARTEHAAIGAFARFSLELEVLGAPAKLVEATQHAAALAIGQTMACFGVASRLAGERLSPGPLDVAWRAPAVDLESGAASAVRVCVAETVGALLAGARHEQALGLEVRDVLDALARQKARRAELAWRSIGWALDRGGEPIRHAVVAAFVELLRKRGGVPDLVGDLPAELVRAHGLLDEPAARAMTNRAFDDVLAPVAVELAHVRLAA